MLCGSMHITFQKILDRKQVNVRAQGQHGVMGELKYMDYEGSEDAFLRR